MTNCYESTLRANKSTVWNDSKAHGERKDCSVKAVALATGVDYDTVHEEFLKAGRVKGAGTYQHQQRKVIETLGYEIVEHDYLFQPNGSRYTPKTIGNYCRRGNWMAYINGHVFAVIDGVVLDWTEGRQHRIKKVWRITPIEGEDEMTIRALTVEYNTYADELGLPTVKKLKTTKQGTPQERVDAMKTLVEEKRRAEAPVQQPTGIKKTRKGTSIYTVIEVLLKGGTLDQIQNMMAEKGVEWRRDTIRAAISWDLPKKGYEIGVEKDATGTASTYRILNSDHVV